MDGLGNWRVVLIAEPDADCLPGLDDTVFIYPQNSMCSLLYIERQDDVVVQSLSESKGSTYLHQQCHLPSTSDTQSLRDLHLKFASGEDK